MATGAYIGDMVILAIVGMGFYLCVTGVRRAVLRGRPFEIVDKVITVFALLVVGFLAIIAVVVAVKHYQTYAILSTVFALLYGWVVGNDALSIFKGKGQFAKAKYGAMNWYIDHMSRMGASYITAVGAFTAVQNVFGNTLVNFLLPGMVGIVMLNISRRYFIRKLNLGEAADNV